MPISLEELANKEIAAKAAATPTNDVANGGGESETAAATDEVDAGAKTVTPAAETKVDAETEVTLRQIIAESRPGLKGLADKYADDDSLLEGLENLAKKIGERDQASGIVAWLQEAGITQEDLMAISNSKKNGNGKPSANGNGNGTPDWDESWFTVNAKGEIVATADAPADFDARATRWRNKMTRALYSPTEMKKMLGIVSQDDIEATVAKTREQLLAGQAQRDQAQEIGTWATEKRNVLYGDDGTITPLGKKVNEILASGELNPEIPFRKRAERALQLAAADIAPKPTKKPLPPVAKRQAPVMPGTQNKMTDRQFFEKYGRDLKAFAAFKERGELPADE